MGGRGLLATALAAVAGVCVAAPVAGAEVVYVTTFESGVLAYDVAASDGALTPVQGSPFPAGMDGFGVTATPDRRHLYVSNYEDNTLSAFGVATGSGVLSAVGGSPFATTQPVLSAVTPNGRFLYLANDGVPGSVSGFAVDAAGGGLTPVPGSPVTASADDPYGVAVSPDGGFLYVSSVGSIPNPGSVAAYRIDAASGAISEVAGSPFTAGDDPGGVAITPDGRYLYVANSESETISAFARDPSTGALDELPGSPFPADPGEPTGVVITPDGRHLYTANSSMPVPADNLVLGFEIGTDGGLTPVPGSPFDAGAGPTLAAIGGGGRLLYVTNNGSADLSGYAIDAASGTLTELAKSPFPTAPNPLGITISAPPTPPPPPPPPPSPPSPPGPPPASPTASWVPRAVHVTRRGVARVAVRCTGPAGQRCQVRLALRAAGATRSSRTDRLLGRASASIAAGRSQTIGLRLTRAGRRTLSRRARVRAELTLATDGAAPVTSRLTLRAARAPAANLRTRRVRAGRRGWIRLRVRCGPRRAGRCHGRLVLRDRAGRVVAARRVSIAAGRTRRVGLRLRARARSRIERGRRLTVRARTRTSVPVGIDTKRGRRLTIR